MNHTVQLHPSPGAGFDSPFELLAACHERVARMLGLLNRLRAHLQETRQADRPAAEAARDVMRYFDLAAPHHHEDEERHIFPVLLATGNPAWAAMAEALQRDHQTMHRAWLAIRPTLHAMSQGAWDPAQADTVFTQWQAFEALYEAHARLEDEQAYPATVAQLDALGLQAMGEEMAARRGLRGGAQSGLN